jgi:hypothetical protein
MLIGSDLRQFMKSETFKTVIKVIEDDLITRILTAQPHEIEKITKAHTLHHAMQELVGTMNSIVMRVEMAEASILADDYDDEAE